MSSDSVLIDIVGAGGLGVPAAWGLLELWNGPLPLSVRIYDADVVQVSNLHRQTLYETKHIGEPKALVLAERLNARAKSAQIKFSGFNVEVGKNNIPALLSDSSLVLEASDSVETKFLVNDFCCSEGISFCYAGAVGYEGQLLFVKPSEVICGCLRCLFREFSETDEACLGPTCRQAGILGPIVGEIGFLQAELACLYLRGELALETGSFFYRHERGENISRIKRDPQCPLHRETPLKRLDLRERKCPSTYLYTKLAIDRLPQGEILAVEFGNLESAKNVSLSVIEEGHHIVASARQTEESVWELIVRRGKHD